MSKYLGALRPDSAAVLLLATALLAGTPALADTEYYVVVSSLRSDAHAQAMRERAEQEIGAAFQIAPVTTESGRFLRVMAGPYLTRRLATSGVRDAKASGFDRAWLLASAPQVPQASAPQVPRALAPAVPRALAPAVPRASGPAAPELSALSRALAAPIPGETSMRESAERLPRRWSTTRPPASERSREARATDFEPLPIGVVPVLIQQAPEGYRLHRLERE